MLISTYSSYIKTLFSIYFIYKFLYNSNNLECQLHLSIKPFLLITSQCQRSIWKLCEWPTMCRRVPENISAQEEIYYGLVKSCIKRANVLVILLALSLESYYRAIKILTICKGLCDQYSAIVCILHLQKRWFARKREKEKKALQHEEDIFNT